MLNISTDICSAIERYFFTFAWIVLCTNYFPVFQVLLINAVKDVASALADLISATKNASGKPSQDASMSALKDTAKMMVTNVTSLLKTVKTVEDETARGACAYY